MFAVQTIALLVITAVAVAIFLKVGNYTPPMQAVEITYCYQGKRWPSLVSLKPEDDGVIRINIDVECAYLWVDRYGYDNNPENDELEEFLKGL